MVSAARCPRRNAVARAAAAVEAVSSTEIPLTEKTSSAMADDAPADVQTTSVIAKAKAKAVRRGRQAKRDIGYVANDIERPIVEP